MADLSPDDFDKMVRTVYGEAAREPPHGQQAVAAVIMNRARLGKQSPTDVVLARNQFEPWGARRGELERLDPNSPMYQSIAQTIRPIVTGEAPDPTNGATHFYGPGSQRALGRRPPSWDNGTGSDIGNHRFFRLGYGGSPPAASPPSSGPAPMATYLPQSGVAPQAFNGETPEQVEYNRRLAAKLLGEGTSAAPVGHWTQALARVTQGLSGGMAAEQARKGELAGKGSLAATLAGANGDPQRAISALLSNPWANGMGEKLVAGQIQNQLQENTPAARADLAFKQAQTKALTQKTDEPEIVRQLRAANIDPASPEGRQYILASLKGSRPQSAFDVEIAKKSAGDLEERTKASKESQGKLQKLDAMERLVSNPAVYQGKAANYVLEAKKLGMALGMNFEGVPEAETLRALSNQFALSLRSTAGGEGMPGALSDADRNFLLASVVGLTNTDRGNMAMIKMQRAAETYKMKANDEAVRFIHSKSTNIGLPEHMAKWTAANPMFDDKLKSEVSAISGVSAPSGGAATAPSSLGPGSYEWDQKTGKLVPVGAPSGPAAPAAPAPPAGRFAAPGMGAADTTLGSRENPHPNPNNPKAIKFGDHFRMNGKVYMMGMFGRPVEAPDGN